MLRHGPYRLFWYSNEQHEPPHVHVDRDLCSAKFWLQPVRLARSMGFGGSELRRLHWLVIEHRLMLLEEWHGYFDDQR